MTSSARSPRRLQFASSDVDLARFARPGLLIAIVAAELLIYHLNRGSSFSADDWIWITTRRANSVHTFLAPYNGHLSVVPIAIYRLMFASFGISSFVPYRLMLLVVGSATGLAIFEYTRHRVGAFCALLVTAVLLLIGPGWNDIMQPFQIAWLIALATGILALSLLDRHRAGADAAASLLILISLSSTSVGVALAVGVAVEIALTRHRWRDAWIPGLPLLVYVVWAVHYHPAQLRLTELTQVPYNIAQTTAAALAGLLGVSGATPGDLTAQSLTFGFPLLGLALVAVVLRARSGWDWSRFASLAAATGVFTLMVTLARSFQSPFESRYMYVTCVLVALMAVEVARGLRVSLRAQLALALLALVVIVSNIGELRSYGGTVRQVEAQTDATLGAVELDRFSVRPETMLTQLPGYPFTPVSAGQYFAAAHVLGTPAYTVAQLERAAPGAQAAADAQFLVDGDVTFGGLAAAPTLERGAAPAVEAVVAGSAGQLGSCARFVPEAALTPGATSSATLALSPGRTAVSASTAPVTVSVRRFASGSTPLGMVRARGTAVVSVSPDRAPQTWHLQIQSVAPVRVCTLGNA